jgi:hypothetical protein
MEPIVMELGAVNLYCQGIWFWFSTNHYMYKGYMLQVLWQMLIKPDMNISVCSVHFLWRA